MWGNNNDDNDNDEDDNDDDVFFIRFDLNPTQIWTDSKK